MPRGAAADTQSRAPVAPRYATAASITATLAEWLADPALRGGDYWRQGIFCRLLLAHDPEQPCTAAFVIFGFLRPVQAAGQPPQFVRRQVVATPADEVTVLAQIRAVDAAIRRHEFNPGCGQCRWCRLRANSPT